MDAREISLLALNDCQRQGGWSDAILKKRLASAGLDSRDGALATQLCFGVLQNRMLLDFYLSHFSNLPLKRMEGRVVEALRLGAYQMLFLDRIPHSAAVNASVELTRKHCKNPRAAGMVNGILRNLERNLDSLPTIPQTDPVSYLSTVHSHPEWLVRELLTALGSEETAKLLAANNGQAPMTAMVNRIRTTVQDLIQSLEGEGVQARPHPWLSDCLILEKTGNLERLTAFREGLFYIQDPASQLPPWALAIHPGENVIDLCAAPGGKSLIVAQMQRCKGNLLAMDIHGFKCEEMEKTARRYGAENLKTMEADSSQSQRRKKPERKKGPLRRECPQNRKKSAESPVSC